MLLNEAFGEVLREARLENQLSQEVLAQLAGLHRNSVSNLERGIFSPTLENLFALAEVLGKQPDELVKETKSRMSKPTE